MFKDLAQRAEKLMRHSHPHESGTLFMDDYKEAARLMAALAHYAERQSSYPNHLYEEEVTDEDLHKVNLYYIWYKKLADILGCENRNN